MYEPVFNSVLVQIDDKDAEWGSGNNDSMLGESYSKGEVIRVGKLIRNDEHPTNLDHDDSHVSKFLDRLKGRQIMWNEGVEAGTVFEFDGRQFAMIYWWDIRGVKVSLDEEPAYQDANKKANDV